MNAAAAFSHREAELLEQLAGAQEIAWPTKLSTPGRVPLGE